MGIRMLVGSTILSGTNVLLLPAGCNRRKQRRISFLSFSSNAGIASEPFPCAEVVGVDRPTAACPVGLQASGHCTVNLREHTGVRPKEGERINWPSGGTGCDHEKIPWLMHLQQPLAFLIRSCSMRSVTVDSVASGAPSLSVSLVGATFEAASYWRMDAAAETPVLDLDLSAIDLKFSRLRLMDPQAEARMLASMRRQGQLTPIVVGREAGRVFLVDGFKRYRALHHLGTAQIRAQVLERPVRSLKAAIVQLNGRRGLTSIEESWVLQSLHQDDGLTQEQIGALLGRHKSWVCRRLALVERLCDEALEHLRIGLINARTCRHLLLLPRGNQPRALECVIKHHLSSRETGRLVQLLRERPERQHEMLLWQPLEILDDRVGPRPRALTGAAELLARRLRVLDRKAWAAAEAVSAGAAAAWSVTTRQRLHVHIQEIEATLTKLRALVCSPARKQEVI